MRVRFFPVGRTDAFFCTLNCRTQDAFSGISGRRFHRTFKKNCLLIYKIQLRYYMMKLCRIYRVFYMPASGGACARPPAGTEGKGVTTKMAITGSFVRTEKKYLLNNAQLAEILRELGPFVTENEFGASTVASVYYDNDDFHLIQRSIEKPMYKEKLRVRAYDPLAGGEIVFAEIKKKYGGIVYKRRVSGGYEGIRAMLSGGALLEGEDPQIQRELRWMILRYGLAPKIWVCCERLPLQGRDDPELRFTFDSHLRYQTEEPDLRYDGPGREILPGSMHVMEIKSDSGLPEWLCEILSRSRIYPGSFSKVGTAFCREQSRSINQKQGERKC